jgi:hypothetical protein
MAFAEHGCVRRFFRSYVDGSGATTRMCNETCCGLDHTRRARCNEDSAFIEGTEDAIQLERHLAEPADVRSNPAAALALG